MNRAQKRQARHQGSIDQFTIRNTGINPTSGLVAHSDRKCTDVICGGLFWITIAALLGVSIYCLTEGNITTLIAPVDGRKNICGYKDASKHSYLFFADETA
jgi:hypothetical protein